jgi:CHAT domain-containing protein
VDGQTYAARTVLPKLAALREAQAWLRALKPIEVRKLLRIDSDADWQRWLTGARGLDVAGAVATPPSVLAEKPLFEQPYYWAAFILIGDPE